MSLHMWTIPLPPRRFPSKVLLAALMASSLAACQPYTDIATSIVAMDAARLIPTDLRTCIYGTVDDMLNQSPLLVATGGPIVVGSIADIQDVNQTTPLGNTIAELVRSRLVQKGLTVTDLRLRARVRLDHAQGEMTLSRDMQAVVPPPIAAEIVSGTYAVGNGTIYVSLKVIAASDARIMAAGDFTLPRTADVDRLLLGSTVSLR
jgi:hypothetical protein